jgi:hypothetical protein
MIPGPTIIRRCNSCQGLLKAKSILSGNTGGAQYWTDGEMQARMLPRTPGLIKCSHCSSIQWTEELEEVDSFSTYIGFAALFDKSPEFEAKENEEKLKGILYETLPYYDQPNALELFDFANAVLPLEKQLQIRLLAWRKGNDDRRNSDKFNPLTKFELDNLEKILQLMRDQNQFSNLIYAEVLRELGRYEESRRVIETNSYGESENKVAQFLLELIDQRDSQVCQIKFDDSLEWRMRRRLRSKEKIEPPDFDPNGPKLFKIMSRDWWFKVTGMLSHNWALIELHEDNTVTVFFFYDHGISENRVPNFDKLSLVGRCAVIDSLEFEGVEEAEYGLANNSFSRLEEEPGPWDGSQPIGNFYDARSSEKSIYSSGRFWKKIY